MCMILRTSRLDVLITASTYNACFFSFQKEGELAQTRLELLLLVHFAFHVKPRCITAAILKTEQDVSESVLH